MTTEAVLEQALTLSAAERLDLVEAIWDSVDAEPGLTADEEERRVTESLSLYRANPSDVTPWSEVRADLRNRPARR
jgi:putative addiction module component (TIGR02574 family)